MNDEVKKWIKRTNRKGPFLLYGTKPIKYFVGWDRSVEPPVNIHADGTAYTVIWKDKKDGKVRIGVFKDGMHCRYGVNTYGVLSGNSMADFWQATAGMLDETEMAMMMRIMKGEWHPMGQFDPATIESLTW
ncbi:hypothetical protein [Mesorhizobium sp. M8A.F.Ca.ET.021.01.1.1]|uniref:hypothetical protein n=1 Tax=Mesorhizobium sp. M8A.F.Ca.ET.021.01.1.1 TaxID=2496757 RepID=UPI000FCC91C2|nr:hypothetical protein [Mesorhizobium sp. M8A.F.Ca.ET.021.01.1.1]RUW57145.1 hypothetical protein EOA36_00750 [Mesorhizobium sp. M8A.F.Ca.ET.021.01.1.1]